MSNAEDKLAPDLSRIGYGAIDSEVTVNHDASQNTTHQNIRHTQNTANTHHEDKRRYLDQSRIKQTTVHHSGMPWAVAFGIICVIIAGILGVILLIRPQERLVPENGTSWRQPAPQVAKITTEHGQSGNLARADTKQPVPPVQIIINNSIPPSAQDGTTPPPPGNIQVHFDREDRVYHDKDKQSLRITVPKAGYLYAANVWADGQMRILCHPDLLTPVPGPVQAGQTVEIPAIQMSFTPPDPAAESTEEEVRVVLSETPLAGIPSNRKADIRTQWETVLGVKIGSPHQRMRVRGGELPDPETQPVPGMILHGAAYRMLRGVRPEVAH